jgi:hypothetical protein
MPPDEVLPPVSADQRFENRTTDQRFESRLRSSVPPDALAAARAHAGALRELATFFPPDQAASFCACADLIESMAQLAELDAETRDAIDAYELNFGVVL